MVATVPYLNGPLRWTKVFEISFRDRSAANAQQQQQQQRRRTEHGGSMATVVQQQAQGEAMDAERDQQEEEVELSLVSSCASSGNACTTSTAESGAGSTNGGGRQQQLADSSGGEQQQEQPPSLQRNSRTSGTVRLQCARLLCFRSVALNEPDASAHRGSAKIVRKPGRPQAYLHMECSCNCNQSLLELLTRHDPNRPAPPSCEWHRSTACWQHAVCWRGTALLCRVHALLETLRLRWLAVQLLRCCIVSTLLHQPRCTYAHLRV
jgi:hypothetical protein